MVANNFNNKGVIKNDKYLIKILEENKGLKKYEPTIIVNVFKYTLKYFIENFIPFEIKDFFKFELVRKKESNAWAHYRREHQFIPEHTTIRFKLNKKIKDYVNERHEYSEVRHREFLPLDIKRK